MISQLEAGIEKWARQMRVDNERQAHRLIRWKDHPEQKRRLEAWIKRRFLASLPEGWVDVDEPVIEWNSWGVGDDFLRNKSRYAIWVRAARLPERMRGIRIARDIHVVRYLEPVAPTAIIGDKNGDIR